MSDTFEFQVPEYTVGTVTRLLIMYVQIKTTLSDRMPTPNVPLYRNTGKHLYREKPLGASAASPWPFMSKQRAPSVTDGKKRARMSEDLHVAVIDLEEAFQLLTKEEQSLLYEYYVVGGITFEELAAAKGLSSKGRLYERIQRIVRKLTKHMNHGNPSTQVEEHGRSVPYYINTGKA